MITAIALAVASCGNSDLAGSQAGVLDPSFSGDGLLTRDFFGHTDIAVRVLVPRAGGVLISGSAHHDDYGRKVTQLIMRLREDGSPDRSFGRDGVLGVRRGFSGLLEQADGKLLLLGSVSGSAAVARLMPDGAYDASFGRRGVSVIPSGVITDANCGSAVSAAAVMSDGRIAVVGALGCGGEAGASLGSFQARLRPNGKLDRSFGRKGARVSRRTCGVGGVAVQSDGKLLVAENTGSSDYCTGGAIVLTRLRRDGAPDDTFGTRGRRRLTFPPARSASATRMALDGQGRIVVAGEAGNRVGIARLLATGRLDRSFDDDGRVTRRTRRRAQNLATSMALDGQERITVSAYEERADEQRFVLLRFNVDGRPDASFGADGMQVVSFGSDFERAEDVAIDAEGRTVAVGMSYADATQADFVVARVR